MDDLDRLFRYLVRRLADTAPGHLRTPFQVSELYQSLIPYRTHKGELGFEAIEDYDMAVLRLLAGERGYASVEPEDVQEELAAEAGAVHPNPAAFREYAAASVILNVHPVRAVLDEHSAYAPPPPQPPESPASEAAQDAPVRTAAPPPEPLDRRAVPPAPTSVPAATVLEPRPPVERRPVPPGEPRALVFEPVIEEERCSGCDERLPPGRNVVFCPYCGRRVGELHCVACGEELEPDWRFCLRCGAAVHE